MDIKTTKIDTYLKEIGETALCDLPEKEPWTVTEFLDRIKVRIRFKFINIQFRNNSLNLPCYITMLNKCKKKHETVT